MMSVKNKSTALFEDVLALLFFMIESVPYDENTALSIQWLVSVEVEYRNKQQEKMKEEKEVLADVEIREIKLTHNRS
jgi:hypothetical protein